MEHLKRLMTSDPKLFATLLEWYDNETDGGLECYRLRNMDCFDDVFDGLSEADLNDMYGYHFDRNDKYFYTTDGGYVISINEKDYSSIIYNHPFILNDLIEWLTDLAEWYGVEIER